MDTLKRRHNISQAPDSPPPKYSDTYEPVPVSDEKFSPTLSEKDGKVFRKNHNNKVNLLRNMKLLRDLTMSIRL